MRTTESPQEVEHTWSEDAAIPKHADGGTFLNLPHQRNKVSITTFRHSQKQKLF